MFNRTRSGFSLLRLKIKPSFRADIKNPVMPDLIRHLKMPAFAGMTKTKPSLRGALATKQSRVDCRAPAKPSLAMMCGFSLVELSIVLVILGLLTGGILGGQSLMRAAELRSVTKEFEKYQMAVNTFHDKYFALPGDMPNATQFWGRADDGTFSGQCADETADVGTGTQTCNGQGDGWIGRSGDSTETYERFRFWEHLANAGLVEGEFTGVTGSGASSHAVMGENVPAAKYSGAGWSTWSTPTWSDLSVLTQGTHFPATKGNNFIFGAQQPDTNTSAPLLSNEDAWGIDTKMDDGKPATGAVMTQNNTARANCASDDTPDAEYQLNLTGASCALYLRFR